MRPAAYAGVSLTARDQAKLCQGTFDQVQLLGAKPGHRDVRTVCMPGSSEYVNGVFKLTSMGSDIWLAADELHFAHRPLSGDGSIVARVTHVSNTNELPKAAALNGLPPAGVWNTTGVQIPPCPPASNAPTRASAATQALLCTTSV